jgi:hypothetical protein
MPRPQSDRHAALARRARAAELYVRGWTQQRIADHLNVTQQAVCRALKLIRREWRAARLRNYDQLVDEQLPRIDAIEAAAWDGWERSRAAGGAGNVRFLAVALNCVERRCKLIGADAPTKVNLGDLDRLIDEQLARLAGPTDGPRPTNLGARL